MTMPRLPDNLTSKRSDSDFETGKTNEFQRRRTLRILQVREQSKDIARRIRNNLKENQNFTNFQRNSGTDRNYEKTLQELQSRYEERLEKLGTSHSNASIEEQEDKEWKTMMETQKRKSLERGRRAGKEFKEKEHAKEMAKSAPMERRKQARVQAGSNLHNSRHSKKPKVKTILSPRFRDKFASSDDEFNSITDSEMKINDQSFLNSPPVKEKPVTNPRTFERDESVAAPFSAIHNKIERLLNENEQMPSDVTNFQNRERTAKDVVTSDEIKSIRSTIEQARMNSPITTMSLSMQVNEATASQDPPSLPELCNCDFKKSGENIRKKVHNNSIIEKIRKELKNSNRKACNDSTCEKLKRPSTSAKTLLKKTPKTHIKKLKSPADRPKTTQPYIKILQNTSTQTITKTDDIHAKVETIEKSIQTNLETVSKTIHIEDKTKSTSTQTDKNELTTTKEKASWTTNSIIEKSAIEIREPVKTKSTSTETIASSMKPRTKKPKKAIGTKLTSTQTDEYKSTSTDTKESPRAGLPMKQSAQRTRNRTPKAKMVKYSPKPAEKPSNLQIIIKLDKNKQSSPGPTTNNNPDVESSLSTVYLSPGTYAPASEEPKKKPASNLDPRVKSYINRLLKMGRVDLNEFSVSSISSVSISNSVINIESNNPNKTIKPDINNTQSTKKTWKNLLVENKTIAQAKPVETRRLIKEFNKVQPEPERLTLRKIEEFNKVVPEPERTKLRIIEQFDKAAPEPERPKLGKVAAKLVTSAINLAEYVEDRVPKPEFTPILSDIPKPVFRSSGSSDDSSSERVPRSKPSKRNLSTIIEYDTVLTEALNKTPVLHDVSVRPFITYEDYIAAHNLSDHAPSASERESSTATDKTLPDIGAELIKRNMITKPFTEKSASSTTSLESFALSSSSSRTLISLTENSRSDDAVDSLKGEISLLTAKIEAAKKTVESSADSNGSVERMSRAIDSLFRQSSFQSLLSYSDCTPRELNTDRKRTSTPVDLGKSSVRTDISKTANISHGLFNNSCDLSSVKLKTNNSDNDDLAIPNISLHFRNNNYDSSQSGVSSV